ncbi:MAG: hypothetical protein ACR2QH_09435, partial [Geminicoccaceae bacterium]
PSGMTTSEDSPSGNLTPIRLELDPSRSPTQPPNLVETMWVVGRGSGMEQVKNQLGWYNTLIP